MERGTARTGATSSDVVSNRALCRFTGSDIGFEPPPVSSQVPRLPANPTSSSVRMAAAPSSFGAVMETTTAKITQMKQTAVSPYLFQMSPLKEEVPKGQHFGNFCPEPDQKIYTTHISVKSADADAARRQFAWDETSASDQEIVSTQTPRKALACQTLYDMQSGFPFRSGLSDNNLLLIR